jgi:hypothetical protein
MIQLKMHRRKWFSPGPFQLAEYIQMACLKQYSACFLVKLTDGRRGSIDVVDGEIWNAVLEDVSTFDALCELLSSPLQGIHCETLVSRPAERRLCRSWRELVHTTGRGDTPLPFGMDMALASNPFFAQESLSKREVLDPSSYDSLPALASLPTV